MYLSRIAFISRWNIDRFSIALYLQRLLLWYAILRGHEQCRSYHPPTHVIEQSSVQSLALPVMKRFHRPCHGIASIFSVPGIVNSHNTGKIICVLTAKPYKLYMLTWEVSTDGTTKYRWCHKWSERVSFFFRASWSMNPKFFCN